MEQGITSYRWWRTGVFAVGVGLILSPGLSWGLEIDKTPPTDDGKASRSPTRRFKR